MISGDGIKRFHFILSDYYQIMAGSYHRIVAASMRGDSSEDGLWLTTFSLSLSFYCQNDTYMIFDIFSTGKISFLLSHSYNFSCSTPFSFSLHNLIWLLGRFSSGDDMRLTTLFTLTFTSFYFHAHFHYIIRLWLNRHIMIIFYHHITEVGFVRSWHVASYFYMIFSIIFIEYCYILFNFSSSLFSQNTVIFSLLNWLNFIWNNISFASGEPIR